MQLARCPHRIDAGGRLRCLATEAATGRAAPTTAAVCAACQGGRADAQLAEWLGHFAHAKAAFGVGWFPLERQADVMPDPAKCLRVLETHTPSCGCSQLRTYRCHRGDGMDWRRCQHMDNGRPCGEFESQEE